jgi:hypothetical protein
MARKDKYPFEKIAKHEVKRYTDEMTSIKKKGFYITKDGLNSS